MKNVLVLFSLLFAVGVSAAGQDKPQWELFGGYQYTRLNTGNAQDELNLASQILGTPPQQLGSHSNLNGWNASIQQNSNHWIGGLLDFSGSYTTRNFTLSQFSGATDKLRDRIRLFTYMGGPQVTLRKSGYVQPFARGLFGGATLNVEVAELVNGAPALPTLKGQNTGFAMGGGGGLDFHVRHAFAVRLAADYIRTYLRNDNLGHLRVSGGLDFRIGSR